MKWNLLFISICLLSAALWAQDSFFEDEEGPALTATGTVEAGVETGLDTNALFEGDESWAEARIRSEITLAYETEAVDVILGLELPGSGYNGGGWEIEPRFTEAFGRWYFANGDIELGLLKPVWGSGDGVHVIDLLTPLDYSRFVEDDYAVRKSPAPMFKINLAAGESGRFEAAYVPYFIPDYYPAGGRWVQGEYRALEATTEAAMASWNTGLLNDYISGGMSADVASLAAAQTISNQLRTILREENTMSPEYFQAAVRYTRAGRAADFGVMAYTGYIREPVVTAVDMNPADLASSGASLLDPHFTLEYSRSYTAGFDLAGTAGGFGYRGEFAATFTNDFGGDDPDVRNPRLGWVAGIDRDLGVGGLYVNFQTNGEYILFENEISGPADADYREDYTRNIVSVSLSGTGLDDTLDAGISAAYHIEGESYRIKPEVTLTLGDIFDIEVYYSIYEGDAGSLFGQFDANDYLYAGGHLYF